MKIGTEHEFSINDPQYRVLPINDELIKLLSGKLQNEFAFGDIVISKELQKHVLELKPYEPLLNVADLDRVLHGGIKKLYSALGGDYRLLGLGMHPMLKLDQTTVWDHEEGEIYTEYDRVFNIKQHGWLNIQALQINIPYKDPQNMVAIFNRIRALIPYLMAVSAASPFVEGRCTDVVDNRALYYLENQKKIPGIAHGIIPEKLSRAEDYDAIQQDLYNALRAEGAERLCQEWVNSRGVIVRYSRRCVELKAIDEQECIRSDMAVTALLHALLRAQNIQLEHDENALRDMMHSAIRYGTRKFKLELNRLHAAALRNATKHELPYLESIKNRIEHGSPGEILMNHFKRTNDLNAIMTHLERCLRDNVTLREQL